MPKSIFYSFALLSVLAWGQIDRPGFDVASVKRSLPGSGPGSIQRLPGGTLSARAVTLKNLITYAYDVRDFEISGGPSWLGSEPFDITAKTQSDADLGRVRLMLINLLESRFKLSVRRDTKMLPVYALIVSQTGSKVRVADDAEDSLIKNARARITGQKASMSMLTNVLALRLGRAVVDRTGLHGYFDFVLEWTPDLDQLQAPANAAPEDPIPPVPSGPSIFTAVHEQLGLKLEPQRGPVQVLFVEHVEAPSEN